MRKPPRARSLRKRALRQASPPLPLAAVQMSARPLRCVPARAVSQLAKLLPQRSFRNAKPIVAKESARAGNAVRKEQGHAQRNEQDQHADRGVGCLRGGAYDADHKPARVARQHAGGPGEPEHGEGMVARMARGILGRHPQDAQHERVGDVDHRYRQLVEVAGEHRKNDHAHRDEADFYAPKQGKADLAAFEGRPPDKGKRHRHDAPLVQGTQKGVHDDGLTGRKSARDAEREAEHHEAAEHIYIGSRRFAIVAGSAVGDVGRNGNSALPAEEGESRHRNAHERSDFVRPEGKRPACDRAQGKRGEPVGNRQPRVDAHVGHRPHGAAQGAGDARSRIEGQPARHARRHHETSGRTEGHENDSGEGDDALGLGARAFDESAQGTHQEGEPVGELVDYRVEAQVATTRGWPQGPGSRRRQRRRRRARAPTLCDCP